MENLSQFDQDILWLHRLFQVIIMFPDHEDCYLSFGKNDSGKIYHPIKITLYFEDEDGIITDYVEWENPTEGVKVLKRYINQM